MQIVQKLKKATGIVQMVKENVKMYTNNVKMDRKKLKLAIEIEKMCKENVNVGTGKSNSTIYRKCTIRHRKENWTRKSKNEHRKRKNRYIKCKIGY